MVVVEMPGKIARHLRDHAGLDDAERQALQQGRAVRRGQGCSLHVTATQQTHHALLRAAVALNAEGASSADRKAYRIYLDRLNNAAMPTGATLCGVDQKNPCYQP